MFQFQFQLLICLLISAALIFANDNPEDVHAEIRSAYNNIDQLGHFKYGHDISNGVEAKAEGDVNGVHGEYFLLNEKGEKIRVTYTADSTGFHPTIENN